MKFLRKSSKVTSGPSSAAYSLVSCILFCLVQPLGGPRLTASAASSYPPLTSSIKASRSDAKFPPSSPPLASKKSLYCNSILSLVAFCEMIKPYSIPSLYSVFDTISKSISVIIYLPKVLSLAII